MSTDTQEVQEQRAANLAAADAEFAATRPDQVVSDAIKAAGPHLASVVDAVLQGTPTGLRWRSGRMSW